MILRTVVVGENTYFYLFHGGTSTVNGQKKYHKNIKFLGSRNLTAKALAKRKIAFRNEIKNKPDSPDLHGNVIVLLQQIQDKYGYLAEQELVRISKQLDIPAVDLIGVATFYSQFKLFKPGQYKVSICRGTACHVKNSIELLRYAEELLKIKSGQTQGSGKVSLDIVNCMGACAKAPVLMINNKVYGELTKDKLKKIIEGLP